MKFLLLLVLCANALAVTNGPKITGTLPIVVSAGVVSIAQSNTSTNGYLSSTDWNIFNNKTTLPTQTGHAFQFLTTNGTAVSWANTPNSEPGGATTSIQYNNDGAFGGFGTWNGSLMTVNSVAVSSTLTVASPSVATGTQVPTGYIKVKSDGTNTTGTDGLLVVGDAVQAKISLVGYGDANKFRGYRASGTAASPSATTASSLSNFEGYGYETGTFTQGGYIAIQAGSTWTGSNHETYLRFGGTALNATTSGDFGNWKSTGITAVGLNLTGLTATTVPYLDSSKNFVSSSVTPTQLGYLSGASGTTGTGNLVFSASPTITGSANFNTGVADGTAIWLHSSTTDGVIRQKWANSDESKWFELAADFITPGDEHWSIHSQGGGNQVVFHSNGQFLLNGLGTNSLPKMAFWTDRDTGIFSGGDGRLSLVGNTVALLEINAVADTITMGTSAGTTGVAVGAAYVQGIGAASTTDFPYVRSVATASQTFSGGTSASNGAAWTLYGGSHATKANTSEYKIGGTIYGSMTSGGLFNWPGGAVGGPTYSWGASPTSGLYLIAAGNWGLAAGGVKVLDGTSTTVTITGTANISSLTASRAVVTDGSKNLASSATTATQVGYLSTTTSDVQTQLDSKATLASPVFTGQVTIPDGLEATPGFKVTSEQSGLYYIGAGQLGVSLAGRKTLRFRDNSGIAQITGYPSSASLSFQIGNGTASADSLTSIQGGNGLSSGGEMRLYGTSHATNPGQVILLSGGVAAVTIDNSRNVAIAALTTSRAVVSDSSKNLTSATTTATEIGYVNGVTSAIQTQLDGKQATGNYITALTGEVTASGPGSVAATVTNSAVIGKVLTGYSSGSGTVSATDTILQAFNKLNGNDALKAPLASPTFTGVATFAVGAVGAPSVTFTGAATYGLWYDSSNTALGLSAAGVETVMVDSTTLHSLLDVRLNNAATSAATAVIRQRANTGAVSIYGGATSAAALITLYGNSHATKAGFIELGSGGADVTLAGGQIRSSAGSAGTPTYSFGAFTTTGMSAASGPVLNLSTGGTTGLSIDSNQKVTIGSSGGGQFHPVFGRGFNIQYATSGVTGYIELDHTSNTTGSGSGVYLSVAGTNSGDAFIQFANSGASITWTEGIDTSDARAFVIANSAALGSSNVLRIDQTTSQIQAISGVRTKYSTATLSGTPTASELATACGTASSGLLCIVNSAAGGVLEYAVWSDGTNWFYTAGTKAL